MNLPRGPVVKICGLTRLEDVIAARDLGVWAVGFVFAPSPRRLEPAAARGLLEAAGLGRSAPGGAGGPGTRAGARRPLTVGVFADCEAAEVARVADEVGLDAVQLHGLSGPSAAAVAEALGGPGRNVLIIKSVPVEPEEGDAAGLLEAIAAARVTADIVLLDTRVAARAGAAGGRFGGSGTAFRWRLAREAAPAAPPGVAPQLPLLVAGGIGPDNVLSALSESGAWGVDVSSGVESSPGIKDARLMERLVTQVKEGQEK